MNRPVILFDADGFLLDFITPALSVANEIIRKQSYYHDTRGDYVEIKTKKPFVPYTINDLPSWDIFDTIGKEHERACYLEYEKPGWCASIEPYPEAVEGMHEAKKMADVVVVTSPLHSPTWCHERVQALNKYFDIPRWDIIFAARKTLVMGRMLVDDRPSHAEAWALEHGAHGLGVVWDQPYNRSYDVSAATDVGVSLTRCSSWTGQGGLLERIEHVVRAHTLRWEGHDVPFLESR